jgi:hypothetical protein
LAPPPWKGTCTIIGAPVLARCPGELRAFRITASDSIYFACLLDSLADGVSFTLVVEIF